MSSPNANNKGYIAGEAGARSTNNPYQHGTDDYYNWQAGWREAQDDYIDEQPCNPIIGWEAFAVFVVFLVLLAYSLYTWWVY